MINLERQCFLDINNQSRLGSCKTIPFILLELGVGGFWVIMLVNKVINFHVNVTVTKNFIGRVVFSIF